MMNIKTKRNKASLFIIAAAFHASLAAAQAVDIAGEWEQPAFPNALFTEDSQDRGLGPDLGDYAGLPINAAAQFKAQHYHPDWLTVPEHQCIPHPVTYQDRSPLTLSVAKDFSPVTQKLIAYRLSGNYGITRTIWMDGRPHPSRMARHTFEGFSTGRWFSDKLAVQTTHIKAGWLRRNGVPTSDRARVAEYYVRHGDVLTVILAVDDPLYLDEPFVRSTDFRFNVRAAPTQMTEFGFINGGTGPTFYKCGPIDEVEREAGLVPSNMPGQNRDVVEMFATNYHLPLEAAFGGTQTVYPEFMQSLRNRNFASPPQTATPNAQRQAPRRAPAASAVPSPARPGAAEVLSQHVGGQVWMISIGGQNTTVQIGDEGVLVVDPGSAENAQLLLAEIRRLSDNKPVRVVINTSADLNRISATPIVAAGPTPTAQRATVIGHENVGLRMGRVRDDLVPNDVLYKSVRSMYFNGEPIQIIPVTGAYSDGDTIVHFGKSEVIATGNVLRPETYPTFDTGGSLQGTIDALNRVLSLTVAEWRSEGGTMVVPGTDRLYDQADVAEYRDMLTIVRDRLNFALKNGMSPAQIKAANYTRDYDGRYGSRPGPSSTDQFLTASLQSLTKGPASRP